MKCYAISGNDCTSCEYTKKITGMKTKMVKFVVCELYVRKKEKEGGKGKGKKGGKGKKEIGRKGK